MNYINKVELLHIYITPAHTEKLINSPCPRQLCTRIFYLTIGCVLRQMLQNLKKVKALAPFDIPAVDPQNKISRSYLTVTVVQ